MEYAERFELIYLPYDKEGMKSSIFRERKKQGNKKFLVY